MKDFALVAIAVSALVAFATANLWLGVGTFALMLVLKIITSR